MDEQGIVTGSQVWEYKVITIDSRGGRVNRQRIGKVQHEDLIDVGKALDVFGAEGWELVSVWYGSYYFKRPVEDDD